MSAQSQTLTDSEGASHNTEPFPASSPRLKLIHPLAGSPSSSLLARWHLLSLDAPTVAALWTFFIARTVGLHLPWVSVTAMFVAVWMLYAADRLLDARPNFDGGEPSGLEERHRFHQLHRRGFLGVIMIAALMLATLLHHLDPKALHLYSILAVLLSVWLLLIHASPSSIVDSHRLPKELAVGVFFPAAVFIPTVARLPHMGLPLLPSAVLFACICTLNCLFVYAWEHPTSVNSHWTTRWALRHLLAIAAIVLLLSALAGAVRAPGLQPVALACGASTTLLLLLHTHRDRVRPVHLRAAVDLALLTPLPMLFLLR